MLLSANMRPLDTPCGYAAAHRLTKKPKTMTYKISYRDKWSPDGTHFSQTISCKMTKDEVDQFNLYVNKKLAEIRKRGVIMPGEIKDWTYLRNIGRGDNYANLTTVWRFCEMFGIDKDPKYKYNRNTMIRVERLKWGC